MNALFFAAVSLASTSALADNALSADQLMQSVQNSLKDYATVQPEMSKSISGFRVATVGKNAQVNLMMSSDGMSMSAKYVCAPQDAEMSCTQQQ